MTKKSLRGDPDGKKKFHRLYARYPLCLLIVWLSINCSNALTQVKGSDREIGQLDSTSGILRVKTRPPLAEVTVDDTLQGLSPFQTRLLPGKHIIVSKKAGYVPARDTVLVPVGDFIGVEDTLFSIPVLNIRSVPAGAQVYVDSLFHGRTPIDSLSIAPGKHVFTFRLANFRERSEELVIRPGMALTLSQSLIPTFGFAAISVFPVDSRVVLDSSESIVGSVTTTRLPVGWHTITVSHPAKEEILESRFYLFPGSSKVFEGRLEGFSYAAAVRSVIVPGLGQILDGGVIKGTLEMLGVLGAGYLLYDSHESRSARQSDFNRAKIAYQLAETEGEAIAARGNLIQASADLTTAKNRVTIATATLGILYALTIVDALVFNSTFHELLLKSDVQLPLQQLEQHDHGKAVELGVKVRF